MILSTSKRIFFERQSKAQRESAIFDMLVDINAPTTPTLWQAKMHFASIVGVGYTGADITTGVMGIKLNPSGESLQINGITFHWKNPASVAANDGSNFYLGTISVGIGDELAQRTEGAKRLNDALNGNFIPFEYPPDGLMVAALAAYNFIFIHVGNSVLMMKLATAADITWTSSDEAVIESGGTGG